MPWSVMEGLDQMGHPELQVRGRTVRPFLVIYPTLIHPGSGAA